MTAPNAQIDRLLREAEVADHLGIPKRTIQAWRLRGEGPPFFKLGRAVRYRHSDLEAWLADNRATSTAPLAVRSCE
ncbi:helix-turn-helix transcriptional regulator [Tepidamorphus sp. 3E244]|uniref:helix-turn-helix transcriptional regulator n=1 Tax=Tepidamorphus sp. 3E244 TaxID=3385498 RepID=UPI0038FC3626